MTKIEMPKALLKKWLKALRSGKYTQTTGTLYDPETKGFCCLGVLEHCAMDGMVETFHAYNSVNRIVKQVPLGVPSIIFYRTYNIKMPSTIEEALIEMNDSFCYWKEGAFFRQEGSSASFKEIADYIEANSVGI